MFVFVRESAETGEGQRERETEDLKLDSMPTAESPMWGSNSRTMKL